MGRSYMYDWTRVPAVTNDPKCLGKLVGGKHQKVLLNGEDIGNVNRCVTGGKNRGWIEREVLDKEGRHQVGDDGEILTEMLFGKVEYICDD